MTLMHRSLVGCALAACAATLNPAAAAAQADSGRADSALARHLGWASRTTLPGWVLRSILTDDPAHVLGLVPGVVLRRAETGLAGASAISIRGGAPGEASVYIDGAPVRFITLGTPGITLGSSSVAEVAVTTGPPDLGLPDMRDGVIEYVTRSGGQRVAGSLRAATDQALSGVGFRRFEGSLGGPFVGVDATWIVGGSLMDQRSHYAGLGTEDVASFIPGGIDTLIAGDTLFRFSDRRAYDWGTELRGYGKLQFAYRGGGTLSVTGVSNEVQQRFFPGTSALAPTLYAGSRSLARLVVVNWRHSLRVVGIPLTLLVNASHGTNELVSGLLEPESEMESRSPGLGFTLDPLRFSGADSIPSPLTAQIIRNIRSGGGNRVPFLGHPELANVQTSRANPFGMAGSWPEQGFDGPLSMINETRSEGRWVVAWDPAHSHRLSVGGDLRTGELGSYTVRSLRSLSGLDAYRAAPQRVGVYFQDRFGRGALRGEFGMRYDLYGRVGRFADTPGRIYTHPEYNTAGALVEDTAYTASVRRVMTIGRTHHGVSFRAAVEREVAFRTMLRATYGRWLEPPPVRLVLHNVNADLEFTSTAEMFGRDVDYGYASLGEVGVRHRFAPDLAVDAAIYRRTRASYGGGIRSFPDPANPPDSVNVNVLTKLSDVVDLGLDVALDWRPAPWLTTRAVYALRQTDPGDSVALPFGGWTLDLPRYATHAFTMAAIARPPQGLLAGFEGSALLRLVSGTWYSRGLSPGITSDAITPPFDAVGVTDNHQLPWTRRLDVRLKKTFLMSTLEWAVVAEARNVLAWRNVLALFAETRSVDHAVFRAERLDAEFQGIESEAADNSRLLPNGDIDLVPNCASWTQSSAPVVNCVALRRAEARFGNGDGVYTLAERTTALYAFFNAFYGPHTFYGSGRSVRLGVEIHW